jgi:flagellar protein FliL
MSKSAPKAEAAAEAAPKKGKGKLIVIAAVALVVLAGGGAGAWVLLKGKGHDSKSAHKKEEKKTPPVFVNLEPFTVNLQEQDDAHFLQTEIVLQVTDDKIVEPIKVQMPIIRSGILLLLSSKSAHDLGSAQGKRKLAQEIIGEIRKHLALVDAKGGVENILFSSFVIQ